MQTFYLVIEKSSLSLFSLNNYERIPIEGNEQYTYDLNYSTNCINILLEILANEFNLDSIGEIDFIVINNEDKVISEVMNKALEKHIKKIYDIEKIVENLLYKLNRDKKLYIDKYGINFDGKSYIIQENKISKKEFNLLGYTITDEQLIKFVE